MITYLSLLHEKKTVSRGDVDWREDWRGSPVMIIIFSPRQAIAKLRAATFHVIPFKSFGVPLLLSKAGLCKNGNLITTFFILVFAFALQGLVVVVNEVSKLIDNDVIITMIISLTMSIDNIPG